MNDSEEERDKRQNQADAKWRRECIDRLVSGMQTQAEKAKYKNQDISKLAGAKPKRNQSYRSVSEMPKMDLVSKQQADLFQTKWKPVKYRVKRRSGRHDVSTTRIKWIPIDEEPPEYNSDSAQTQDQIGGYDSDNPFTNKKKKKRKRQPFLDVPELKESPGSFQQNHQMVKKFNRQRNQELKKRRNVQCSAKQKKTADDLILLIQNERTQHPTHTMPYQEQHLQNDIESYIQSNEFVPTDVDDLQSFSRQIDTKMEIFPESDTNKILKQKDPNLKLQMQKRSANSKADPKLKYLVRGNLIWGQEPDAHKKPIEYSAFGTPMHEAKPLPECSEELKKYIERLSAFARSQGVHEHDFPLRIANDDGDVLLPLVEQEEPLKYRNMDRINFGILGLHKRFYAIQEKYIRAHIIKKRYERFYSQKLKERIKNVLQTTGFNPHLNKLVSLLHYTHQIKYVCSHFYPSQLDTRITDFSRYKSGMANLNAEHAEKYLPDIVEIDKILMKDKAWIPERISKFNNSKTGFVQHLAGNGPNKQYCHDMCQKCTDVPGRVSSLAMSYLCQLHIQNMNQALECMPLTPQAMFLLHVAFSPITQSVEHLQPILASCVGKDSIECRHMERKPIMTYGKYTQARTYTNEVRDKTITTKLTNKGEQMSDQDIKSFFIKEIDSLLGIVTPVQVYAFDIDLMKTTMKLNANDDKFAFRLMKVELINLMLEIQATCPAFDSLIWEPCFTRNKEYVESVFYEDCGFEAEYNTKPRKDTRFNMSFNCKLYKVAGKDNEYDLKFRLNTTGTLSELQQVSSINQHPDDLVFASANGKIGLDQEKGYVDVNSFSEILALNSAQIQKPDGDQQGQNLKIKESQKGYLHMSHVKGVQCYALCRQVKTEEECAKVQMLASIITNEECRHILHTKQNMPKLAELAMLLQAPANSIQAYTNQFQQVTSIPLTKLPLSSFVTYLNDSALSNIRHVTEEEFYKIYDEAVSVLDIYYANKTQKAKSFLQKMMAKINEDLSTALDKEITCGDVKDKFGQTMPGNVLAGLISIGNAKSKQQVADPNVLITSTIEDACDRLVKANQVSNMEGQVMYFTEMLRSSLNNDISFSTVFAQFPTVFSPDQIVLGAKENHVRLPLWHPLFLLNFRDFYRKDELIQDIQIIFTSIPNAYKFIVRAAFTLFMNTRRQVVMPVHYITHLYINTISLFNWFEYLGFFIVSIPYYAINSTLQNEFMNQSIQKVKVWAFYQIFTVVVRVRELFLQELSQMIDIRRDILNQLDQEENAKWYQGFILDPMLNQQFDTFDPTLPFQNSERSPLNLLNYGIRLAGAGQQIKVTAPFEVYDVFRLSDGDHGRTESNETGIMQQRLYPDYLWEQPFKGDVNTITLSVEPNQLVFQPLHIHDLASRVQQQEQQITQQSPTITKLHAGQDQDFTVLEIKAKAVTSNKLMGQPVDKLILRQKKEIEKKEAAQQHKLEEKPKTPTILQTEVDSYLVAPAYTKSCQTMLQTFLSCYQQDGTEKSGDVLSDLRKYIESDTFNKGIRDGVVLPVPKSLLDQKRKGQLPIHQRQHQLMQDKLDSFKQKKETIQQIPEPVLQQPEEIIQPHVPVVQESSQQECQVPMKYEEIGGKLYPLILDIRNSEDLALFSAQTKAIEDAAKAYEAKLDQDIEEGNQYLEDQGVSLSQPANQDSGYVDPDDSDKWSGTTSQKLKKREEKYIAKGLGAAYIYETHTPSQNTPVQTPIFKRRKRENPFKIRGDSDEDNGSGIESMWVGQATQEKVQNTWGVEQQEQVNEETAD